MRRARRRSRASPHAAAAARSSARVPTAALRASLLAAISQSTNRASGMVRTRKISAVARYGVKLNVACRRIWVSRKISTTPMDDTSTVSFWRPMKSLSSGGITRRTACGSDHVAHRLQLRQAERPRRRPSGDGWTESMPAR